MPAVFEVVAVEAGHAWRLVGADDLLLAVGPAPYRSPEAALAGAEAFREAAPRSEVELSRTEAGTFWTLVADGRVVARSPARLGGEDEARAVAAAVRSEAAAADLETGAASVPGGSGPAGSGFDPSVLDRAVIALPLLERMEARPANAYHRVIIDLNLTYQGGRPAARARVVSLVGALAATASAGGGSRAQVLHRSAGADAQYVVARLTAFQVRRLVQLDRSMSVDLRARLDPEAAPAPASEEPVLGAAFETALAGDATAKTPPMLVEAASLPRAIFRVWPDFEVQPLLTTSVRTVKGDAAHAAFSAFGEDVVWAVVDSGVEAAHPHFATHRTFALPEPLYHRDFTLAHKGADAPGDDPTALRDPQGHGTHVAGILAGEHVAEDGRPVLRSVSRERFETTSQTRYEATEVERISGVAPRAKILSLRVLDEVGGGHVSDVIAALSYIHHLNAGGRFIRVHGVNLSVGYEFDAEWFACGHSPLCKEVDLLARSGVVVVVAAGNTGYGKTKSDARTTRTGLVLTINDPGNAERAITVGATHRAEPHRYGVSYFSSKGPTGDGRRKPDLVAPGEKILSAGAGGMLQAARDGLAAQALLDDPEADLDPAAVPACHYVAESGTSMAAPHVSGAIAAFLSVRPEFIGRAEAVKRLFLDTATDLGREPHFQGHGLVDLMRAMQAV
ncbi:MAG: S8 family peptidase [Bacteroidota bacterium]